MKKLIVAVSILTLLFVLTLLWWKRGSSAVDPKSTASKIFVVEKGEGVRSIANKLKSQGLINDPVVFFLLVKQKGLDGKIQAGSFRLTPAQQAADIAESLTHGTLDTWITIPEGKRAEEIAEILEDKIPTYSEDWRGVLILNEGYLFPDTYLIPKDADINLIVSILRNNFNQKYGSIRVQSGLSMAEIVTIASLIEREAITEEEKPIISGIIKNRITDGMALEIDATIQYAKGYDPIKKAWWSIVTPVEYQSVRSPYNTYLNAGLPPTPIANPGLSSLAAAANPANTSYYYYLHDKNRKIRFAETNEEHIVNIQRYGL